MVEGYTQSEYIKRGPFVSTWDTTKSGVSTSTQVLLPLLIDGSYAFYVDWGDGSSSYINAWNQAERLHTYSVAGVKTIKIRGLIIGFIGSNFASSDKSKLTSITSWGCLNFKSLPSGLPSVSFSGCTNLSLTSVNDTPRLDNATNLYLLFNGLIGGINNIGSWNVSNITNMSYMFSNYGTFDGNIGSWDVSKVTTFEGMFQYNSIFNNGGSSTINTWNTISATNMSYMFDGGNNLITTGFNQPVEGWNVSNVTSMTNMFNQRTLFNRPIGVWNVSSVISMNRMLNNCLSFNQPLAGWERSTPGDTSTMANVKYMSYLLAGTAYNYPVNNWNTSSVLTMDYTFSASAFNQPVNLLNTSNVTTMIGTFQGAAAFNQPLNSWDVSKVQSMRTMFYGAVIFNQPLNLWNIQVVSDMSYMFLGALEFNSQIDTWRMTSVTATNYMFSVPVAPPIVTMKFNQPLANWERSTPGNTSTMANVLTMTSMFGQPVGNNSGTSDFKQYIGNWNLGSIAFVGRFMSIKTIASFPSTYLDDIYNGWIQYKLPVLNNPNPSQLTFGSARRTAASTEGKLLLTRTANAIVISNVTNNGSGLIRVTLATAHTLITGNKIFISEVTGTTEANGLWVITNINSTTLDLQASVYSNTYISGGSLQTGYGWTIVDGGVTP
jgi:hypothetical protein